MKYSYYNVGEMTKTSQSLSLSQIIRLMRTPDEKIKQCESLYVKWLLSKSSSDKEKYQNFKRHNLPKVTWSGEFEKTSRTKKTCIAFSGLITIDIDGFNSKQEVSDTLELLNNDKFTFLSFRSPSQYGIKLLIKVNWDDSKELTLQEFYEQACIILADYYLKEYNITVDPSGKDVCRLCYLTYDKEVYVNNNSETYDIWSAYEAKQRFIIQENNINITKVKSNGRNKQAINSSATLIEDLYTLVVQKNIIFSYHEWMTIGIIFFKELDIYGFEAFDKYSKVDTRYKKDETEKLWLYIVNTFNREREDIPTIKRLIEILRIKGIEIDSKFVKQNNLFYCDNDLPFLIKDTIGKCYIDEIRMTYNIKDKTTKELVPLNNIIRNQMLIDIKKRYLNCTKQALETYFESQQNVTYFNPLKIKLESLKYSSDDEFNKLYGYFSFLPDYKTDILKIKKWMLGVMTMIYNDGTHYDHMLIFLGRQDAGKTFFIREKFCSIFREMNHICEKFEYDKAATSDQQKLMARNAIILDDESTFSKKEARIVKTVLSTKDLQFVEKYEKDITVARRIASFIGTTNHTEIYDDETGGKRFHVIDLGDNILQHIGDKEGEVQIDFDKIWGYIVYLFLDKGVRHTDIKYENNNDNFRTLTVLDKLILDYFEVYRVESREDFINFKSLRMDVHKVAENYSYDIKRIIDSPRGLAKSLKVIFGDDLQKYVPRDKRNTYYNVRLKREYQNMSEKPIIYYN